jgi:hypothetical protein
MIKKVVINGQLDTLLVLSEEKDFLSVNPYLDALNDQEERIEALEQQNLALIEQGEALLSMISASMDINLSTQDALETIKETELVMKEYDESLSEELSTLKDKK